MSEAPGAAELRDVTEALGPDLMHVICAPRGLAVRVADVVIHDVAHPAPIEAGDLVLGVGLHPDDPGLPDWLEALAAAGAAGLVIRGQDPPRGALLSSSVAVLALPADIAWSQAHGLIRTAVASAGSPADPGSPVPFGDLFALANAVASLVGGAATIEGPTSQVLAYSSLDTPIDEARRATILGRRVPETFVRQMNESGVWRALWSGTDPLVVDASALGLDPGSDFRPRLAIAIRAGGEFLGSIWVSQGDEPFGPHAPEALREAARVAALHLIRHRVSDDLDRQRRREYLRAVLEGRAIVGLAEDILGIDPQATLAVVAFRLAGGNRAEQAVTVERLLTVVSLFADTFRWRGEHASIGNTVYSLLQLEPTGVDGLVRFAVSVYEQWLTTAGVALLVGLGSTVSRVAEAPASRADAERVLRVLPRDRLGRTLATIHDVRGPSLLLELGDAARSMPHLSEGPLSALVDYDDKHNSDLVATLRAYLDAWGNLPAAAASLDVHPSTFRYRLQRAESLVGVDLKDPDERLALELQLRFFTRPDRQPRRS